MNKDRTLQWTEIDTDAGDETGDTEFQVNLNRELQEAQSGKQKESQNIRRGRAQVQNGAQEEAEEDNQNQSQRQEDQSEGEDGQGAPGELDNSSQGKKTRAHKRIQTLLARERELQATLQQQAQEIQRLSGRTRQVEKTSVTQQRDQWEQAIKDKELALEEAVNKNDGASVAKLSRELADATMRFNAFKSVAEDLENEPEPQQQQVQPVTPEVPEAAKDWFQRNPWFAKDAKKHVLARQISQELTNEGVLDPNEDEYWDELDKRIADFTGQSKQNKANVQQENIEQVQSAPPQRKRGSPVGSRSDENGESPVRLDKQFSRQGNKVTATPTDRDYEIAEQLGIKDIKDYMREKFKYAQQDYKGYVTIDVPGQ